MDIATKAFDIAMAAHNGQFRRDGTTPYFIHVQEVMERVAKNTKFDKEYARAVAISHDIIEDTKETKESLLAKGLPDFVVDDIVILTHLRGESYTDYILRIKERGGIPFDVKIEDILHNLSDSPTDRQIIKYAKALLLLLEK